MKSTDYAPRAAPFDAHLTGRDLVGVEVGVDAGAHAEALLRWRPVAMLHLVDTWPNPYIRGYCEGRLATDPALCNRFEMLPMPSLSCARRMTGRMFDFVYLDQEHDADSVTADLRAWFPLVKPGGILGHRNYVQGRGAPLDVAIENFVEEHNIRTRVERYLNDVILYA